ncbi:MAG: 2Fe-2S iron-sulfur cluster-binding protein [Planctomycetota bacterium]|jgi:NADH-quinone oxidoreductase subunit G|nr:2Fe-2S iron-sulfur cluster-binding protein [Planctomycetota bacterium]MDP6988063.1 2Fe-2S iron-sulfur cluster-binding protein [Planctomycetota bacterium]
MPELTIDGRKVSVPDGTTVIEAAEQLGIFIPRYCYHPGLSTAGNCRMCMVDVENSPKPQIACNLPATEGMVVETESEQARKDRAAVLEFLLANHPLDCPVCDQAGECDLQNYYMNFGLYDPRFSEQKVKKEKAVEVGPHVMLDQERCILCSRCVRFTDEITKTGEFGIFNRGDRAELGLYPGETLDNPYSANVVDLCPVGALTERSFRFKARVWYLSSTKSVCGGCSRGCNTDLHHVTDRPHLNDAERLVRVKPRFHAQVNEWWMCDEGRYGHGWIDRDRLGEVRRRTDEASRRQVESDWDAAENALAPALAAANGRLGVVVSATQTTEELFSVREVLGERFGARIVVAPQAPGGKGDDFLIQADKAPNRAGARLLGLSDAPADGVESLVDAAIAGELDSLWVFGEDLVELVGAEKTRSLALSDCLFVYAGTNDNPTVSLARWVLPTAVPVEADGTFVNCDGRVQRVGRAFAPLAQARECQRVLCELASRAGVADAPSWSTTAEVFAAIAKSTDAFAGMSFESLGEQGALAASREPLAEAGTP